MTYSISIYPQDLSLKPGVFQIHIATDGSVGNLLVGNPVIRDYQTRDELIRAANRLGLSESRVMDYLDRNESFSISGIRLANDVAAEFGLPTK